MTFKFSSKPWCVTQKRTLNGYEFSIDSASSLLTIATVYGSTNPLWDSVPGAKKGQSYAYLIAAAPELYDLVQRMLKDGQFFLTAVEAKEPTESDFEQWEKDARSIITRLEIKQ